MADEVRVGIDELFAPANFSFEYGAPGPGSAEVLAVFLLRPKICPPCLGEVQDYITAIDRINLEGGEVMPLALVFTNEPTEALHFIRTSALPIPAGYGYPTELATRLGHRDGATILQQLVFIDAAEGTLFHRVMLPNTVTPAQEKERLLTKVLADRRQDQPLAMSNSHRGETS
ncbi:MAG: hypothetical protein GY835_23590 [bacterium]|nr:hypothetical protein [bacterium]